MLLNDSNAHVEVKTAGRNDSCQQDLQTYHLSCPVHLISNTMTSSERDCIRHRHKRYTIAVAAVHDRLLMQLTRIISARNISHTHAEHYTEGAGTVGARAASHLSVVTEIVLLGNGNAYAIRSEGPQLHGEQVTIRPLRVLRHIPLHNPYPSANDIPCKLLVSMYITDDGNIIWVKETL